MTRFPFSPGVFGRNIYVWNLSCRNIIQCIDLGEDSLPLSVKFLHNRNAAEGYVSCALSGVIYRFYKCQASVCASGEPRPGASGGPAGRVGGHRGGSARAARVPRAERLLGGGRGDSHPRQGGEELDHAQDARLVWPPWHPVRGDPRGLLGGAGGCAPPELELLPRGSSGAACSVLQPSSWTSSSPRMTGSCTSATGGTETSASTS